MLWKSLLSSAFKTKTNSLYPVLLHHMGQKAHSCCPYWEKREHDLLLACIWITLMPAVESLLNFLPPQKLKLFFSQYLLFCSGHLNNFGAPSPKNLLLTNCAHPTRWSWRYFPSFRILWKHNYKTEKRIVDKNKQSKSLLSKNGVNVILV